MDNTTAMIVEWFSKLTAYEWLGIVIAVVVIIVIICKILGFGIVEAIFEIISSLID